MLMSAFAFSRPRAAWRLTAHNRTNDDAVKSGKLIRASAHRLSITTSPDAVGAPSLMS